MNLKEIRESKGFTQNQMAEKMAMEQTTYSKKERGISPINANEWKRLSEIFEIPIEDLHKIKCPLSTKNEHKNQQTIQLPKNIWDVTLQSLDKLAIENAKLYAENTQLKAQLEK
jgi:transcriptional regulator with XRE-family HTH domain